MIEISELKDSAYAGSGNRQIHWERGKGDQRRKEIRFFSTPSIKKRWGTGTQTAASKTKLHSGEEMRRKEREEGRARGEAKGLA